MEKYACKSEKLSVCTSISEGKNMQSRDQQPIQMSADAKKPLAEPVSSLSTLLQPCFNKSGKDVDQVSGQNPDSEECDFNVPKTMENSEEKKSNIADFMISKDDPLCEDIISCISALDEMLAEFDDTSLPYTAELETSCGDSLLPTTDELAVTDSVVTASSLHTSQKQYFPSSTSSQPPHKIGNLERVNANARNTPPVSTPMSFLNGNQQVDQNQNLNWNETPAQGDHHIVRNNSNGPLIQTSHLIQIPVVESTSSQPGASPAFNVHHESKGGTFSSSGSIEMNGNNSSSSGKNVDQFHRQSPCNKKKGNSGTYSTEPKISSGGGTYSKGTSYEILIPKITSGTVSRDSSISSGKGTITTSSHSSRASIMVPVIESPQDSVKNGNAAKVRSQLNMGIFQPSSSSSGSSHNPPHQLRQQKQSHVVMQKDGVYLTQVPVQADVSKGAVMHGVGDSVYENQAVSDCNYQRDPGKAHDHAEGKHTSKSGNISGVTATYIALSEGKSSLGQSSSSGVSSTMLMMKGDEEQWNFPSEKNLPRSLRKTRKTCFLDEGDSSSVDSKMAKSMRGDNPYCCGASVDSQTMCTNENCYSNENCCYMGETSSCHKSPRDVPRRTAKCEIINKGDGNFALSNNLQSKQVRNGQQSHQAHVSTSPKSKNNLEDRGYREKNYQDVILSQTSSSASAPKIGSGSTTYFSHGDMVNNRNPSSSFTSSSGVRLSVTSNPVVCEEESQFHPASKSRKAQQHQQFLPKPRVRQQVPSPGTEIPIPNSNFDGVQNQFIPLVVTNPLQQNAPHQNQDTSTTPISSMPLPSRQSPEAVEIGAEEEHHGELQPYSRHEISRGDIEDDETLNTSSSTSPIKLGLRKSSLDTEFEETVSDSKVLKIEGKARRESKGHSKHRFEGLGQNGSLPNQSQMMRMMMMMKSKNSSVSSSRSSSSSGSVSVNSSSSDNNCGDVFHENIVQDYPTNIFNVAKTSTGSLQRSEKSAESSPIKLAVASGSQATTSPVAKSDVAVVLRRSSAGGRGNLLLNGKKNGASGGAANQQNSTLEIDDGYLSMINRNEAPLLWPEEFIENETFSKDELKRLSVHLPDGENDNVDEDVSSNSHSSHQKTKGMSEKEMLQNNKSAFPGAGSKKDNSGNNRSGVSSGSNTSSSNHHNEQPRRIRRVKERNNDVIASTSLAGRSSAEKTDYFSDDSLEIEGDDELLLQNSDSVGKSSGKVGNNSDNGVLVRASTSFVIPFHPTKEELEEQSECQSRRDGRNQIRKSNSQVSRIPKMVSSPVSPSSQNNMRGSCGNIQKKDSFSTPTKLNQSDFASPLRKPCSFFIPFSDSHANSSSANNTNDRKLSVTEASTAANSPLASQHMQTRSMSLPSSRRNSASEGGKSPNPQHGIAWSISCSPQGDDKGRQLQTKASSDSNTNSNLSKGMVDSNPGKKNASSQSNQGATVSVPNNNNQAMRQVSKNGTTQEKDQTLEKTKIVTDNDNGDILIANKSKEINNKAVETTTTIATTSNITTTTIPANSSTERRADHKSASQTVGTVSSNKIGDGGSVPKRHIFEKQQTFIVSPSRDITTSGGQRLNDSVGGDDTKYMNDSTSQQCKPNKPSNDDNRDKNLQLFDNVRLDVKASETTDTNNAIDKNGTNPEKSQKLKNQKREDIEEIINELDKLDLHVGKMGMETTSEIKHCSAVMVTSGDSSAKQNQTEQRTSDLSLTKNRNTSTALLNHKSSPQLSSSAETWERRSLRKSQRKQELEKERMDTVSSTQAATNINVGELGEANHLNLEGQESASEELETVVKMFLKATEGLLDPEVHDCGENKADMGESKKSAQPAGSLGNLANQNNTDNHKQETNNKNLLCLQEGKIVLTSSDKSPHNKMLEYTLPNDESSFSNLTEKQPLMTSTPIPNRSPSGSKRDKNGADVNASLSNGEKRLSFLLVSREDDEEEMIEDLHEQPPAFIPEPPPAIPGEVEPVRVVPLPTTNVAETVHPTHQHHHSLDGKATLDLLSQRITRNCSSPVENMSVSQFLHNKKNIWAMYDRPYDEDVLPPSFPRGFASRSQENLIDAMTHERLTKSFSARGQSSTLPLNCRPPPVQRRTSTFRNMFNKFRKHKAATDAVIPEGPEIRDEEAQSITSRETGPSEGKKRGFFSRLFRRSRKH